MNIQKIRCLLPFILSILSAIELTAQVRQEVPFNEQWVFHGQSASGLQNEEIVTLPHSWNTADAQEGIDYYRGIGTYSKNFDVDETWIGQRIFIRFEGANIISTVTLNGHELGQHKGGYAAFCYEITDHLLFDQKNTIDVKVSNEANLEVIPLVGDFNNYGGIYRPVSLIITHPICITPLDYASPGIYITQKNVGENSAEVEMLTKLSNGSGSDANIHYKTTIIDASGSEIYSEESENMITAGNNEVNHHFLIENPHLWNGKKDPYLYKVKVDIFLDGEVIDTKTEPLGLRYFQVNANEGFFLNGDHISLHGVSRHQDRKDKASAISDEDHREDMNLMLEMGINALRLAHYQHAELIYDLTDEHGIIVWAELPWVGVPEGFMGGSNGYENTEAFRNNAKQQLYELIRQNYNHPSIVMWSIFNEIQNPEGEEPTELVNELNRIVKEEDPGRLSVGASMLRPQDNENIHNITDLIAWNRYFGWYYKEPEDMATFLDQLHRDFPDYRIGITEYGAGGSIHQHTDKLGRPNPMGSPHPEEWQSYYHEEHLKIFGDRPFVWGTYVWNMFDFGSNFRREGDHYGINDKGLITYDRKTKKDAFYFYKSNWSEEPVLHITSSRYIFRDHPGTQVKVYTNLNEVTLTVNGEDFPPKSPEKGIVIWEDIKLQDGNNGIIVRGDYEGKSMVDDCIWVYEKPFAGMNLGIKIFGLIMIANKVVIVGLSAAFLFWIFGIRRLKKRSKFKRFILWTAFTVLIVGSVLILVFQYIISNSFGG